ncbi:MAG: hypothetical protein GY773_00920 [Actinomycetia bacterium]|nr:hypothetical protein [Actinomycetes bacterium]
MTDHDQHLTDRIYAEGCAQCGAEGVAVDWLLNVRRFGLERANRIEDEREETNR